MKKYLLTLPLLSLLALASCKNNDEETSPYHNWEARNAQWFAEKYDSAQAAIRAAQAAYPGDEWEQHCDWRIFRTLLKSDNAALASTDHIVCKVMRHGTGTWSAAYTDSVSLYYRGWIMDTNYPASKTNMAIFSQTYFGELNEKTAAPIKMRVSNTVEGFQTAVQYMVDGDDWLIYIPQQMAYGEKDSQAIPSFSTLLFRLTIDKMHKSGSSW